MLGIRTHLKNVFGRIPIRTDCSGILNMCTALKWVMIRFSVRCRCFTDVLRMIRLLNIWTVLRGIIRNDLTHCFVDYLGAADNEYTREVTRKMFVGAVARAYEPGSKFDNMLILSGRQGIGKSTILRKVGFDRWFTDGIKTSRVRNCARLYRVNGL